MRPWDIIKEGILHLFKPNLPIIDGDVAKSLCNLAEGEHSSPNAVMADLLEKANRGIAADTYAIRIWQELSEREKQVTALICAGWSTKEIAERLGIAPSTVKTYVKKIFVKFQAHDRQTLREMLANYDLSMFE